MLRNLLWVRLTSAIEPETSSNARALPLPADNTREQQQLSQQHCGGHPRGETKGLAPALEQMLFQKDERRKRKMEGTPGYPNQPLSLSHASADQIEWEQFNSRKVGDRDPLRQLDRAAAESARQRAAASASLPSKRVSQNRPPSLLDRALGRQTNAIIDPDLYEKNRNIITYGKILLIEGRLQNIDEVVHVRMKSVAELTLNAQLALTSHDFH